MGIYFNQNLKHANFWRKRTKEELMMAEIRARRGASKTKKDAGGRPKLEIDRNEVLDRLSNGESVAETARSMGISRQAVYRVRSSSHKLDITLPN